MKCDDLRMTCAANDPFYTYLHAREYVSRKSSNVNFQLRWLEKIGIMHRMAILNKCAHPTNKEPRSRNMITNKGASAA